MVASAKKTRTAGRPKGSRTADRPIVDVTPTPCPHCQGIAKPTNLHNVRQITGSGRTPDGRQYGAVTIRNGNCGSCGLPITVREYEFTP